MYVPSTDTGLSSTDQKAVYQYGQAGSVSAMNRGEAVAMMETIVTKMLIRM